MMFPLAPTTTNNVHKLPVTLKKRNSDIRIYTNSIGSSNSSSRSGSMVDVQEVYSFHNTSANSTTNKTTNRLRSSTMFLPSLTIPNEKSKNIVLSSVPQDTHCPTPFFLQNRSQSVPFLTTTATLVVTDEYDDDDDDSDSPIRSGIMSRKEQSLLSNIQTVYKNGPLKVIEPNIYLYSQANDNVIKDYDLVINVAEELPTLKHNNDKKDYFHIYWNHESEIIKDLARLTSLMHKYTMSTDKDNKEKKVLIYCQCGVSRSASLIVAYYMRYYKKAFKDAYKHIQSIATSISPNMHLICQLVEWENYLKSNDYDVTIEETEENADADDNNDDSSSLIYCSDSSKSSSLNDHF